MEPILLLINFTGMLLAILWSRKAEHDGEAAAQSGLFGYRETTAHHEPTATVRPEDEPSPPGHATPRSGKPNRSRPQTRSRQAAQDTGRPNIRSPDTGQDKSPARRPHRRDQNGRRIL